MSGRRRFLRASAASRPAEGDAYARRGVTAIQVPAANQPAAPSLQRNSIARLVADLLGLGFSLAAATITARLLGPAGKGFFSSLTLLAVLFIHLFGMGLGEAAVVLVGQKAASVRTAIGSSVAGMVALSALGAVAFHVVGSFALSPDTPAERLAVGIGALLVLVSVYSTLVVWLFVLEERVVLVAKLYVLSGAIVTGGLWLALGAVRAGIPGAVLANVAGAVAMLLVGLIVLHRSGHSLRPRFDLAYLRRAVRLGAVLQVSNLLVQAAGRLDVVLVLRLRDAASAGIYSVALTIGALVGSIPMAISYASFPRIASLSGEAAKVMTARVFRVGITAAVASAVFLAVVSPLAVPLLFGRAYQSALIPTFVVLPAGLLWSAQWLLCRAAAARGEVTPLLASFALNFGLMVLLDVALIPQLGERGAAWATLVASAFGCIVAVVLHRGRGWDWRQFLPGRADVRLLTRVVMRRGQVLAVQAKSLEHGASGADGDQHHEDPLPDEHP